MNLTLGFDVLGYGLLGIFLFAMGIKLLMFSTKEFEGKADGIFEILICYIGCLLIASGVLLDIVVIVAMVMSVMFGF